MKVRFKRCFCYFLSLVLIIISICSCGISSATTESEIETPEDAISETASSVQQSSDLQSKNPSKNDSEKNSSDSAASKPNLSDNNTSSKKNTKVNFSTLDLLIESVPMAYDEYVVASEAEEIRELIFEINSLDRKKTTQKQVDEYTDLLKRVLSTVQYKANDIDTIYITCSSPPTKGDPYTSAAVAVVNISSGLSSVVEDLEAQIKVRGNTSADHEKKPYNIKFSEKKDLFSMGANKKYSLLANALDHALIRNTLAFGLSADLGIRYTPQFRHVDVVFNGKLLGNYLLIEHIDASPTRVDINPDNKDFLVEINAMREEPDATYVKTDKLKCRFEINEPERPTASQFEHIKKTLNEIDAVIASKKYADICKYIDVESFINFGIVNDVMKMVDFSFCSPRFYYKNGKLYAGPVWDFDLSSGNANPDSYKSYFNNGKGLDSCAGIWITSHRWFATLFECSEFKKAYKARYLEAQPIIENLYKTNSLGKSKIESIYADYFYSFERNYNEAGWKLSQFYHNAPPLPTFYENVNFLQEWLEKRNKWLLDNL